MCVWEINKTYNRKNLTTLIIAQENNKINKNFPRVICDEARKKRNWCPYTLALLCTCAVLHLQYHFCAIKGHDFSSTTPSLR